MRDNRQRSSTGSEVSVLHHSSPAFAHKCCCKKKKKALNRRDLSSIWEGWIIVFWRVNRRREQIGVPSGCVTIPEFGRASVSFFASSMVVGNVQRASLSSASRSG
ncbi:hypothetical protein CEXT_223961 [Caerostris extrusa]|uniref:Uncharacterized protein n=1 Tax=Caerostris extrusa TaxID=172846 RepID=A0AAV4MTG2_CAEEX|nr:hypothetical protein CEXT_223961 [Caerostris extrusa]